MYINLDVVMRLVLIGLVVAGIGALITLAMLFKNLIQTMHSLTGALDLLQRDLAKLEGPLDTVDALSTTVNEIQTSAKRAANTAIDTFSTSSQRIMNWVDAKTSIKDDSHASEPQKKPEDQDRKNQDHKPDQEDHSDQGLQGDFKPIKPEESQEKPDLNSSDRASVQKSETAQPEQEKAESDQSEIKAPALPDSERKTFSEPKEPQARVMEEAVIGISEDKVHPNETLVVNTVENLEEEGQGLSANEVEESKK